MCFVGVRHTVQVPGTLKVTGRVTDGLGPRVAGQAPGWVRRCRPAGVSSPLSLGPELTGAHALNGTISPAGTRVRTAM